MYAEKWRRLDLILNGHLYCLIKNIYSFMRTKDRKKSCGNRLTSFSAKDILTSHKKLCSGNKL